MTEAGSVSRIIVGYNGLEVQSGQYSDIQEISEFLLIQASSGTYRVTRAAAVPTPPILALFMVGMVGLLTVRLRRTGSS